MPIYKSAMEKSECKACKQELPIDSFRWRKNKLSNGWLESTCKECERNKAKEYRQSPGYYERRKLYKQTKCGDIKFFVQDRISGWRKKTPNSDLDTDYLVELYNNQKGLCYYSKEVMIVGQPRGCAKSDSLSLDRLIPDNGYVKGNVVWCTYITNTIKQDMTEEKFYSFLKKILSIKDGK